MLSEIDLGKEGIYLATGTVFNIQRYSVHDGPGIRTVVFLKGCPLHCWWCSNPESQQADPELAFHEGQCLGMAQCGRCQNMAGGISITADRPLLPTTRTGNITAGAALCPTQALKVYGQLMTTETVLEVVEKDEAFYIRSGGGLTLSGGEAFAQPTFALDLLKQARSHHLHTAVETCGCTSWEILDAACRQLDYVIFDIKCMDEEKHRRYTGVSNQDILKNFRRMVERYPELPVLVRTPIIPGVNDERQEIQRIAAFLSPWAQVNYELLPYHAYGRPKYEALGRLYRMGEAGLVEDQMNDLRRYATQNRVGKD